MTLRHQHHHHHHHHHRSHAGRQARTSLESRRNSDIRDADFEQEQAIDPTYESGIAGRDSTVNSHLGLEVPLPVVDSVAGPDVAQDLRRRDEVTQTLTAVVATAYDVIIESGTQTIAQVTVTSLPAVVSVPNVGTVSIPAASNPPAPLAAGAATVNPAYQIPLGTSSLSPSNSQVTSQIFLSTQLTDSTTVPASAPTERLSTPSAHAENAVSTSLLPSATAAPSSSSSSSLSSRSESSTIAVPTSSARALALSSSISAVSSNEASQTSLTTTFPSSGSSTNSPAVISATSLPSTLAGSTISPISSSTSSSTTSAAGSSDVGKIVGGVVGGVSGLLFILLLAVLLFRWRTRQTHSAGDIRGGSSRDIHASSGPRSAEMASQRSSNTPLAASAILGRWASSSSRRSGRRDEVGHSSSGERGFQKISGRKIPSVLHTGGDGYGDEIEEETYSQMRTPPLEATSPVSPISAIGGGGNHRHAPMRDDAIAAAGNSSTIVMRPSPARTPTASSIDLVAPSQASQRGVSPMRPDPLGRTLSRYDGSRGSRFTEGI